MDCRGHRRCRARQEDVVTPEIRIEGTATDPAQRAQHRLQERGDELLAELAAKVTLVADLQFGLGDREERGRR